MKRVLQVIEPLSLVMSGKCLKSVLDMCLRSYDDNIKHENITRRLLFSRNSIERENNDLK